MYFTCFWDIKLIVQVLTTTGKWARPMFSTIINFFLGIYFDALFFLLRLSSMYADSPDEVLCFNLSDKGIDMVQSEYAVAINDLVEEHLHGNRSFPVFLSELTLDLFKKTTLLSDSTIHRT